MHLFTASDPCATPWLSAVPSTDRIESFSRIMHRIIAFLQIGISWCARTYPCVISRTVTVSLSNPVVSFHIRSIGSNASSISNLSLLAYISWFRVIIAQRQRALLLAYSWKWDSKSRVTLPCARMRRGFRRQCLHISMLREHDMSFLQLKRNVSSQLTADLFLDFDPFRREMYSLLRASRVRRSADSFRQ